MAGGEMYTREELLFIAASVARFERPDETYRKFAKVYGNKRGPAAIKAKRSDPVTRKYINQIVSAGLAALAPVDNAVPLTDDGPSQKLKAHWDPDAGELTLLKPRDGTWSKPADLLDRAGIAWEEGDNGEPVPLHWVIQGIDLERVGHGNEATGRHASERAQLAGQAKAESSPRGSGVKGHGDDP
jgi:hypothetical protein